MPKKNSKRGSKKGPRQSNQLILRDPKEGHEYAEVQAALGSARFRVKLVTNGAEVVGKLKGSMTGGRGFEKVVAGNLVLVTLDGCTTGKDKYFIFHKYSDSERKQLEKLGELTTLVESEQTETAFAFEGDEVKQTIEAEIDNDFINDI